MLGSGADCLQRELAAPLEYDLRLVLFAARTLAARADFLDG